jgi:hypothetical protein
MQNLFNPSDVNAMTERINRLTPTTQRLWGKMSVDQMLAHLNMAMQTVIGTHNIPSVSFIPRMIGSMMRKGVLSEKPWGKNSPTDKTYRITEPQNFAEEKSKLLAALNQFLEGGPAKCTTHPHPFFGNFTPEEWALFQWKHMDHHLRQFGV